MFAAEIRRKRVHRMRQFTHWRWHLDEMFVKINGEMKYLWRAVDHEGEVLESYVSTTRDKAAALKFIKKALTKYTTYFTSCFLMLMQTLTKTALAGAAQPQRPPPNALQSRLLHAMPPVNM
jgi:transposase-like protein